MRIVIDIMIGLMLVAVVAGGLYMYNAREQGERNVQLVQEALLRLENQATYHRALESAMSQKEVLLVHVHTAWFGEDVPANALLDGDRPWIDLAPPGDLGEHPPDPVVYDENQAGFWYNPTTGTFRARVSPASTEAITLALYNEVNGTAMGAFEQIPDPSRSPIAHNPGTTPARQYASMANKTWSQASVQEPAEPDAPAAEPFVLDESTIVDVPTEEMPLPSEVSPAKPQDDDASDAPAVELLEDPKPKARPTLQKRKVD